MYKNQIAYNIAGIVWDKTSDKLVPHNESIRQKLSKNLDIKKYGNGLDLISMIYVAQPPFNNWREHYIAYNEKSKTLTWQYILDYEQVLRNGFEEHRQLLVLAYLEALEEIERHNQILDFDFASFRRDVQLLFQAQGWLLQARA
ncbi:MAG: hypothetical protein AAF738_01760 [Bacteroidota bacterium]